MDQLQPQPEVITSSLVRINSTSGQISALAALQLLPWNALHTEEQQVDWLILHFNYWFPTIMSCWYEENLNQNISRPPIPLLPASSLPMVFNSALHEISHWTIAGKERRLLADLGYWYAPDGRTESSKPCSNRLKLNRRQLNGFCHSFWPQVSGLFR